MMLHQAPPMHGPSLQNNQKILHCWKEIAAYLSAGVRTVQRWEVEFALPVRRPRGTGRSPVLAFSSEIDAWVKTSPALMALPSLPQEIHMHQDGLAN